MAALAVVALAVVALAVGASAVGAAAEPAHAEAALWPRGCPVASPLREVYVAWKKGADIQALSSVRALQRRWQRSPWRDGRIAVELLAQTEETTRMWPAQLARMSAEIELKGATAWLVWLPAAKLPSLPQLAGLQQARLPLPMRHLAGPHLSKGARVIGATRSQCSGGDGTGIQVVVVDSDWHGLNGAIAAGELSNFAGKIPYQAPEADAEHGTSCAEIVADVAPGATIWAQAGETLPQLQVALPKLVAAGANVISLSGGWSTGWNFGDGTGPLCALVTKINNLGVAWVNAAGNEADGQIWHGAWQDADSDGWLEFAGNQETNAFDGYAGYPVDLELDWDAYPLTAVDLDLYVCSSKTACTELASAKGTQDGGQAPWETLSYDPPDDGTYYLAIKAKTPPPVGLRVRLVAYGTTMNFAKIASTLTNPADCADAVAVGAVDVAKWSKGKPVAYSSRGPTFDGRTKPELVAPTDVVTSLDDDFNGTSAACPHMAGAVAVVMQRDGLGAHDAVAALLKTAVAVGSSVPNDDTGWGKLNVGGDMAFCITEDDGHACAAPCGNAGTLACPQDCAPRTCVAEPACADVATPDAGPGMAADDAADGLAGGPDVPAKAATSHATAAPTGCAAAPAAHRVAAWWALLLAVAVAVRVASRRSRS